MKTEKSVAQNVHIMEEWPYFFNIEELRWYRKGDARIKVCM